MKDFISITLIGVSLLYISVLATHATPSNTDSLRTAYLEQEINPTKFLNMFPASGVRFCNVFGYKECNNGETYYSPLYEDAYEYIHTYFLLCDSVGLDDCYYGKIISLASQMEWQADGVSYFQHELNIRITDKASVFASNLLRLLHEQPIDVVNNFWTFCLSGTPDMFQNNAFNETFLLLSDVVSNDLYLYNSLKNVHELMTPTAPHNFFAL